MNVKQQILHLKEYVKILKNNNTMVSLFIDPDIDQINAAIEVGSDALSFIQEDTLYYTIKVYMKKS